MKLFRTPTKAREQSCTLCNQADTEEMVQCDACDAWNHYNCAGVTSEVENHSWRCIKCRESERRSVRSVKTAKTIASKSSSHRKQLELQRLELERADREKQYHEKKLQLLEEVQVSEGRSSHSEAESRTKAWVAKVRSQTEATQQLQPLTNVQLAVRQSFSKELPIFTGKPEEWPLFYSSYQESNKLCNFSDAENLLRLQKCLKGKALEAVSSHLLLPKNVTEVIRTLKMMFGRPEIIIYNILGKIRAEPPPKADKLDTLVTYAISVRNLCSTIEASELESHMTNPLLLQELVDKLPPQIKLNWAMYSINVEANICSFSKWLLDVSEAVVKVSPNIGVSKTNVSVHTHETENSKPGCSICNGNHLEIDCKKFNAMKLSERWDQVKQKKLCRICLQKHGNFRCSEMKCSIDGCEARHHKLLHNFSPKSTAVTAHSNKISRNKTYFKIVPVTLYNINRKVDTFAFLDDGSNVTLLEKEVSDKLGLKGEPENLCLKWTSDTTRNEEGSMLVSLQISQRHPNAKRYDILNVHTVKRLSLPVQSVTKEDLSSYFHLKNVPLDFYENAVPQILIGLNNGYLCNTWKTIEGIPYEPFASKTRLGWVIHGGGDTSSNTVTYHSVNECECASELKRLHEIVSSYLSLENIGRKFELKSPEEERANQILQSTTKRIGKRFETGLLWRDNISTVPNSYPTALKRLTCLEKKSDPGHIPIINQQILSLVEKGYARKLSSEEIFEDNGVIWYLPIFTVINPNKPGKVRLVWDAAAKVRGTSLNSMLLTGPDLLTPLLSVLFGFRISKFAISGDIKEMFHQVRIRKSDQNAQRFIWRNNEVERTPDVYVMEVMTFGAACSPTSAQYVKNKNASEFASDFPRAADSIMYHHYVDDLLDGADTEEDAIRLAKEVSFIHREGGFFIRNWRSNSKAVLRSLGELEEEMSVAIKDPSAEMGNEKVLGMWWSTESDVFTYSLKLYRVDKDILNGIKKPTKTDVLRTLMSLFDPLGFLSHYVIYLKIILQEVWRTTEGWTDDVNEEVFKKWLIWLKRLPGIENVKIPRWYSTQSDSDVQLHIFVDASELAYAAVAYFRIITSSGVHVCLVFAKAKVVPKQPVSIPRLELMGAVLGVRIADMICKQHNLHVNTRTFWSDSNTVLSWLRSNPRNFKQFVMYRIGEILEGSKLSEWRYVPTKLNVADDATKWKKPFEFDMKSRWFVGPDFLWQPEYSWPERITRSSETKEELRPHIAFVHVIENLDYSCLDLNKFSSWRRLIRVTVTVFKFGLKLKERISLKIKKTYDMPNDSLILNMAENYLYRKIQFDYFKDEIATLIQKRNIQKASPIFKCSPYLDENNVLRIKGRIDLALVTPDSMKRPIILPKSSYGTTLIIRHYHEELHHMHHDTCLNEIRQKFHIPRLRVELKKVRRLCQYCNNQSTVPAVPEMAILPRARLSAFTRPFSYVGIDFFGPIQVKVARHQEKRWGVLFTCLTVRAIHIEIARDMTTSTCIMVIQNFVARRGVPIEIYSDNGTNFHGAESELKKAYSELDFDALAVKFTSPSTTWHFIPPSAPHMGGSWERLIQSVKKVLYKIVPAQNFKDDTLYSALLECERIINSRPLTYVDLETANDEALTPNHFLLGSSNGSKPLGKFSEDDCYLRKNWRKIQYFADIFWKRWVQEYLPTLTRRRKWFQKVDPIKVDDIVVIADPNLPRNTWPKGIVQSVTQAADGNVRSAIVKTKDGVFNRPVAKLAKLDVTGQNPRNFNGGEDVADTCML